MLDPQVIMNLLPKFRVCVDLVRQRRLLGEGFVPGVRALIRLRSLVSAFHFESDQFHKRLSS